jgi:hypothetical protein
VLARGHCGGGTVRIASSSSSRRDPHSNVLFGWLSRGGRGVYAALLQTVLFAVLLEANVPDISVPSDYGRTQIA